MNANGFYMLFGYKCVSKGIRTVVISGQFLKKSGETRNMKKCEKAPKDIKFGRVRGKMSFL